MTLTREEIMDSGLPDGRRVMRRFKRRIDAGEQPDQSDLEALAEMFGNLEVAFSEGETDAQSVKKALHLENGRGRKRDTGKQADRKTTFVIAVERRRRDSGESRDQALEHVCAERYVPFNTALKWHAKYYRHARSLLAMEDQLEEQARFLANMVNCIRQKQATTFKSDAALQANLERQIHGLRKRLTDLKRSPFRAKK